jgi:Fur family zinc uptake transcriptional regulator
MAGRATFAADHDHAACIDAALDRAAELCARRGARLTRLRRRVLELVWQGHAAVKAYDLLAALHRRGGAAKPPTVYRALDFLMAHGLVHRLESLNAYIGCPDPDHPHPGQFLVCSECGNAIELNDVRVSAAIDACARDQGFKVDRTMVEVRGLCSACRNSLA